MGFGEYAIAREPPAVSGLKLTVRRLRNRMSSGENDLSGRPPRSRRSFCGTARASGDDVSSTPETIKDIVHSAIAALNEELPEGERIEPKGAVRLIGPRGSLSSLQIVNLVIHVEEGIAERIGVALDLTTNEDLFSEDGPLQTLDNLIAYLSKALAVNNG